MSWFYAEFKNGFIVEADEMSDTNRCKLVAEKFESLEAAESYIMEQDLPITLRSE